MKQDPKYQEWQKQNYEEYFAPKDKNLEGLPKHVYRVIRDDENIEQGITARNPDGTISMKDHVKGYFQRNSQYISCTYDPLIAMKWAYNKYNPCRVVRIDLSLIGTDDLRSHYFDVSHIDVGNSFPDGSVVDKRSHNYAKGSSEILVDTHIPKEALTLLLEKPSYDDNMILPIFPEDINTLQTLFPKMYLLRFAKPYLSDKQNMSDMRAYIRDILSFSELSPILKEYDRTNKIPRRDLEIYRNHQTQILSEICSSTLLTNAERQQLLSSFCKLVIHQEKDLPDKQKKLGFSQKPKGYDRKKQALENTSGKNITTLHNRVSR